MHVELPIGAFIAALLVLVPLPWHWRARNIATLSIIAWLFISNLIFAINSIIWANTILNVAPIWCDISTKLQMGANMALPACCLCVCIHLERIASVRQVHTMHAEKVRRMFFDAALCWGLPIIYMALHYIVQGHRFDIVEEFGCRPTIYVSIPAIFLIWVPPMVAALLTLAYAGVALVHFFRRRLTFAKHLQDSTSGLTTSRYFRLMCMSVLQMVWGLLVTSLNMWFTCQNGLRPWISWANVHDGFSQIAYFPTVLIPQSTLTWTFALWWTVPVSSVFFFAFFSFGEEATKEYRGCISWVRRVLFRQSTHSIQASRTTSTFLRVGAVPHSPHLPRYSNTTAQSFGQGQKRQSDEKVFRDDSSIAKYSPTSDTYSLSTTSYSPSFSCSPLDSPPSFYPNRADDACDHYHASV